MKDLNIKLPNGHFVSISYVGIVNIASLVLTNVLFVPIFSFNLIFVSKPTSSSHCYLIFTNDSC